MYKYFIFIILTFSCVIHSNELTFDEFTKTNFFAPIDNKYLKLKAECRKNYDEKGKRKAFEIILYNKNNHIFDLNKHYSSFHEGHKYLKRPFYSFTFWNWFNKVAIETNGAKFMSNTMQKNMRRNELISKELFTEIINEGKFSVFFHFLMDNSKSKGNFIITNPAIIKECFD